MAETVLVDAASVLTTASTDVVAYDCDEQEATFRVECSQVHAVAFYAADATFSAITSAALLPEYSQSSIAATTGTDGNLYVIDTGSKAYVACVVTNSSGSTATVTVAADLPDAYLAGLVPHYFPSSQATNRSGYSFTDIIELVNRKMENFPIAAVDQDEGDGATTIFRLSHDGIVEDSLVFTVDDTANTNYELDLDTAIFEADTPPSNGATLYWSYQYKRFPDDDIAMAIQDAIPNLFPHFYVTDRDTTLSTATSTYEYEMPEYVETVTGVWWRASSTGPWKRLRQRRWSVEADGEDKYLVFHDSPTSGSVKLGVVRRAQPFTSTSDTLSTIGLPGTALEPIVLYACWTLLNQKLAKRVREDQAIATQGEGAAIPDQFQRAISAFRYAYEASLSKNRMAPWSVH